MATRDAATRDAATRDATTKAQKIAEQASVIARKASSAMLRAAGPGPSSDFKVVDDNQSDFSFR